jgi:hypothetical protein
LKTSSIAPSSSRNAAADISVSEAEVDQEILEISKKFGLALDQWYKMLEAERDLSPSNTAVTLSGPCLPSENSPVAKSKSPTK